MQPVYGPFRLEPIAYERLPLAHFVNRESENDINVVGQTRLTVDNAQVLVGEGQCFGLAYSMANVALCRQDGVVRHVDAPRRFAFTDLRLHPESASPSAPGARLDPEPERDTEDGVQLEEPA